MLNTGQVIDLVLFLPSWSKKSKQYLDMDDKPISLALTVCTVISGRSSGTARLPLNSSDSSMDEPIFAVLRYVSREMFSQQKWF